MLVCAHVFLTVILFFYACALPHLVFLFVVVVMLEAVELELGRFVWRTVCIQRLTLFWPSTVFLWCVWFQDLIFKLDSLDPFEVCNGFDHQQ